jgi:hypothetical protein
VMNTRALGNEAKAASSQMEPMDAAMSFGCMCFAFVTGRPQMRSKRYLSHQYLSCRQRSRQKQWSIAQAAYGHNGV